MVLRVVPFGVCVETVKVLRALLRQANEGGIRGLAVSYRTADGSEENILTGCYDKSPQAAAAAAGRMFILASHQVDAVATGRRQ